MAQPPPSIWKDPSQMAHEDLAIVQGLQAFCRAHTMAEHRLACTTFSTDVLVDAPLFITDSQDVFRVMAYWWKTVAGQDFDLLCSKRTDLNGMTRRLQLEVVVHCMPRRHLMYGLLNLLMPRDIPVKDTLFVDVTRTPGGPAHGLVTALRGRWHNWPLVPVLLRHAAGLHGYLLSMTERWWHPLLPLVGDSSDATIHIRPQ